MKLRALYVAVAVLLTGATAAHATPSTPTVQTATSSGYSNIWQ